MLGIVAILLFSWLILHYRYNTSLSILGYTPIPKRILQFFVGLGFITVIYLIFFYLEMWVYGIDVIFNQRFKFTQILDSAWYHIKSALTEDLLFRGVLLYILIKMLSDQKAILISALAFGVYHWISYGMIGGPIIPLIYVMIITGAMGYAWAYAFVKTESIMLGLGLHFGWNFMASLFSKASPFGELLYLELSRGEVSEPINLVFLLLRGLLPPILIIIFVNKMSRIKPS